MQTNVLSGGFSNLDKSLPHTLISVADGSRNQSTASYILVEPKSTAVPMLVWTFLQAHIQSGCTGYLSQSLVMLSKNSLRVIWKKRGRYEHSAVPILLRGPVPSCDSKREVTTWPYLMELGLRMKIQLRVDVRDFRP